MRYCDSDRVAQRQLDEHGFFVYATDEPHPLGVHVSNLNVGPKVVPDGVKIVLRAEISEDAARNVLKLYGWEPNPKSRHFYAAIAE